ncbi:uncharacterized protein LOC129570505 [Sitodiplosis mosellana]|uniref:uncharacterized protein LOC129570505 n=1 Tax=Sitodiplosis mosellana TaxID=263140 RepID=UPI002444DCBE|nr:uncharacterized protein LOC129570505 [Sitodiplosis mosellana]
MVEEYTPRKLRTRSIETRSMATKNSDKIASEKPVHEKEKQTPEKPKRNYKRKSTPVKVNDEMEPKSDANVGLDISPDSTTIPAKRMRFQSIEIKDSDDESTNIPEPPQNTEEQFNSLFGGPSCFKGQVQPNANALHKNLLSKVKIKKERSNSSDHITYILSDSD